MSSNLAGWVALWLFVFPTSAQQFSITTVAGSDLVRNGEPATTVPLLKPSAVTGDRLGNLYIADSEDDRIRKVTVTGNSITMAGTGLPGSEGDGGPAAGALIFNVQAIAVDHLGNLYFADTGNSRVRRIDSSGKIATVASGNALFSVPGEQGTLIPVGGSPQAIAVDAKGNVYVSVESSYLQTYSDGKFEFAAFSRIRMIDTAGQIKTVAGGGVGDSGDGGPATSARIGIVSAIAVDAAGSIYLCDRLSRRVRKIAADGTITAVAGNGQTTYNGDNRPALQASLDPRGVAVDGAGNVYVTDQWNARVRKIDARTGVITTVAGNGTYGYSGDGAPAISAMLASPAGLWADPAGNLFIADRDNGRVRRVTPEGIISTAAGTSIGDGGPATNAFLAYPVAAASDAAGNVYIADVSHHRIRKVTIGGEIHTVAGSGYAGFQDGGGKASQAVLNGPYGVTVDAKGNVYIADSGNYRVRKVTPDGAISAFAGTGKRAYSGDGSPADRAEIGFASAVAADAAGNIYITDTTANRVRKITSMGTISTIAGNGKREYAGDGGQATSAQLDPFDIYVDRKDNIYVADLRNHRVRKIDAAGMITTIAGTGVRGWKGDGGPATAAQLSEPSGVAVDSAGNVYIAERGNSIVRRITPAGVISTIAGTGRTVFAGDQVLATAADFHPLRIAVDDRGNILVTDWLNGRIRKLTPNVPAAARVLSGDGQTGLTGQQLPQRLTVRIVDGAGVPVAGVTVTFAVTAGSATLNPASAVTGADGVASTTVTLGAVSGSVTVTAAVAGLPAATFKLTARIPVPTPRVSSGGVVGGGLSVPPVQAISPNGLTVVIGENFAPVGTSRQAGESDWVDGKLPTRLAGVCVFVGEIAAPILAVQPNRVTFQAPWRETEGSVDVRVAVNCETADEVRGPAEPVTYQSASPEFLYFVHAADGRNPIKAVNKSTGENIGAPGLLSEGTFVAARPGDYLTLQAIGLGATDPMPSAGAIPAERAVITGRLEIKVGEITVPPSDIAYAGLAPQNPGVYLIEIRLPDDVPDGDQTVIVYVNGFASPQGGFITVQR